MITSFWNYLICFISAQEENGAWCRIKWKLLLHLKRYFETLKYSLNCLLNPYTLSQGHSLLLPQPTKLQEGNIFSCVCLPMVGRERIPRYRAHPLSLSVQSHSSLSPSLVPLLVTFGGQDWRPVQTCSLEDPHRCWHLVAEVRMVGERAVRILLEDFLVTFVAEIIELSFG